MASARIWERHESGDVLAGQCSAQVISSDFLPSSTGSHLPSYTWSLPCPLLREWRNPGGLAWGDILPGGWLPDLWGYPLAAPAKVEVDKPVLKLALKRQRAVKESAKGLGCRSPKIQRMEHDGKRLTPQKLALAKEEAEKPVPRRALRRSFPVKESDKDRTGPAPEVGAGSTMARGGPHRSSLSKTQTDFGLPIRQTADASS